MTEVPSHPDEEVARLREQVAGLEERLARLLQILDLVPDYILAVDWDGRILRANKTMAMRRG